MSEAVAMSKEERLAAHEAAVDAASKDPSLSPETGRPVSKSVLTRFGVGFFIFGFLWCIGLQIVNAVLLPEHYKSIEGIEPEALLVDVLPNKEEAGKDLVILNLATTLGQMLGPVIMSSVVLALGYVFAFPIAICFALVGCVFIMLIKNVK